MVTKLAALPRYDLTAAGGYAFSCQAWLEAIMASRWSKPVAFSQFPVKGKFVTQGYGGDRSHNNNPYSIDFRASMGDAYYSVAPGTVVYVDRVGKRDWGNFVTILHDGGVYATYAHFGRIKVNVDDRVVAGTYLGDVGDTGDIDAVHAHVHFGTRIKAGVADGSSDGVPPAFFPAMFDFNEIPSPINREVRSTDVYGTSGDDGEAATKDNFGGTSAANRIFGGGGNDILKGYGGNDELWGGTGSDILIGGAGTDQMTGGPGRDRFDFDSVAEIQRDVILDFSGSRKSGDKIDLSTIDARPASAPNDAFTFVGSNAFSKAGDLRAVNVGGGRYEVSGDVNGDRQADFTIVVYSTDPLTSNDFFL